MNNSNYQIQPTGDIDLFYSTDKRENQCIGHLRGYFDSCGLFSSNWWPHEAHSKNTPEFRAEFQDLVNVLRQNLLASLGKMNAYLYSHPHPLEDQGYNSPHGYLVSTATHDYYIRCTPARGEYNVYIYCYVREE